MRRLACPSLLPLLALTSAQAITLTAEFEPGSRWFDATYGASVRNAAQSKLTELGTLLGAYSGNYKVYFTDNERAATVSASTPLITVDMVHNGLNLKASPLWAATVGNRPYGSAYIATIDWNFTRTGFLAPFIELTTRHELMHILGMSSGLNGFGAHPTIRGTTVDYAVGFRFLPTVMDTLLRDRAGNSFITFHSNREGSIDAAYDLSSTPGDWAANDSGLAVLVTTAAGTTRRLSIASSYDNTTATGTTDPDHIWQISYRSGLTGSPNSPRVFNEDDKDLLRALGYTLIPEFPAAPACLAALGMAALMRRASRHTRLGKTARSAKL